MITNTNKIVDRKIPIYLFIGIHTIPSGVSNPQLQLIIMREGSASWAITHWQLESSFMLSIHSTNFLLDKKQRSKKFKLYKITNKDISYVIKCIIKGSLPALLQQFPSFNSNAMDI